MPDAFKVYKTSIDTQVEIILKMPIYISHKLKASRIRIQITQGFGVMWSAVPEAYKDLLRSAYKISMVYNRKLLSDQYLFAAPLS